MLALLQHHLKEPYIRFRTTYKQLKLGVRKTMGAQTSTWTSNFKIWTTTMCWSDHLTPRKKLMSWKIIARRQWLDPQKMETTTQTVCHYQGKSHLKEDKCSSAILLLELAWSRYSVRLLSFGKCWIMIGNNSRSRGPLSSPLRVINWAGRSTHKKPCSLFANPQAVSMKKLSDTSLYS